MGQTVHHAHAAAYIVGHGGDVLCPGHVLHGRIVIWIAVGLAQVLTEQFDGAQGHAMHHWHVEGGR